MYDYHEVAFTFEVYFRQKLNLTSRSSGYCPQFLKELLPAGNGVPKTLSIHQWSGELPPIGETSNFAEGI